MNTIEMIFYDGKNNIAAIKTIRALTGLGLKDAKSKFDELADTSNTVCINVDADPKDALAELKEVGIVAEFHGTTNDEVRDDMLDLMKLALDAENIELLHGLSFVYTKNFGSSEHK